MSLKKRTFSDNEIAIYDDAVIYKRGEYWQFRMWLTKEGKYARFSLKTRNQSTAVDKAKLHYHTLKAEELAGKRYFSLTTKAGVEKYLQQRWLDVEAGNIVKGRHSTIKTHLEHWLDFIGRDTKLKELERTDCENYYHSRTKTKKKIAASQTTVENEQSTINAMMNWLFKRKETYIDGFEFKKLKRLDRGDDALRRAMFEDEEIGEVRLQLEKLVKDAERNIDEDGNLVKAVVGYYLLISSITGLRRGEQLQLRWQDIEWLEHIVNGDEENSHSLVKIVVRAEPSKVRKPRKFAVRDSKAYFDDLFKLLQPRYVRANKGNPEAPHFGSTLIFSVNGITSITIRAIDYHFDRILDLAQIKHRDTRDLVPYSFRHYFITQRVNSGLHPTAVAEMCGTGTKQIENTYYHTTEAKMISNAMADYYYKDGMLIPK
jgi:integrase